MKSKTKWSESLVRSQFSEFLIDDAIEESSGSIDNATEEQLRTKIEEKSQIGDLRKTLRSIKKMISEGTFENLEEELKEIADDFTWKKSERGQYVSELNDWIQDFHASIRSESRFADLYVGAHAELEVVYVVGSAQTETDLTDFLSIIERNNPPRKILTNTQLKG